jgi:hypothetical protein
MKQRLSYLKALFFAVAMTLAVSATLSSLGAVPSRQPSPETVVSGRYLNPLQVALLYWYPANRTTNFAVGSNPEGVAFDGTDIWVANYSSGTVTKLQASTGKVLGTFAVPGAFDVAFDGANIWVTDQGQGVTKLRASDARRSGSFSRERVLNVWPLTGRTSG